MLEWLRHILCSSWQGLRRNPPGTQMDPSSLNGYQVGPRNKPTGTQLEPKNPNGTRMAVRDDPSGTQREPSWNPDGPQEGDQLSPNWNQSETPAVTKESN